MGENKLKTKLNLAERIKGSSKKGSKLTQKQKGKRKEEETETEAQKKGEEREQGKGKWPFKRGRENPYQNLAVTSADMADEREPPKDTYR